MEHSTNGISLSIFFPVYNDWGTIGSMAALAIATAEQITSDFEVILVNDGSGESTLEVLNFLEKNFPQLRVVHHKINRGYGGALKSGFNAATKDYIFYTDGDAQYDVRELKKLVSAMRPGIDIVNGYKIKRNDPWYRIVIGKLYHTVTKLAFGFTIRDVDCDFRLMRRGIFDRIHLEHNSGVICVEMIKKMHDVGCRFAEVPVTHFHRASGKSTFFKFRRIARVGVDLTKLWWRLVVKKQSQLKHPVHARAHEIVS
ncbi:glycosyltransferase family 2 protein [candidate division KSB1 bacterium]|nr:MAG: glycosyltransferase family 2 protein [candidate division KSB1 bacterium]MCE7944058.1 glycosyltransferase family 2 protein [Chlorobi bacterium CHB1]MDL1874066.1 glycosyltransferase family 2 protein [Cytophagia bacterium CHB2]